MSAASISGNMDSQNTAEENTHVPTGNSGANGSGSDTTATGFACRKCRHSLFDENQLSEAHDTNDRCESYFLSEPKAWMGDTSEVHGKLSCPSCGTKVGHWHWCGVTCSCGAWITPAFQIPHSRVDRLLSRGASVLKDVKMPLFGTPTSVVHGSSST